MSKILGRVPLAGRVCLSALCQSPRLPIAEVATLTVFGVIGTGLTHRWNDPAQYEDSAGALVLGRYLMTTDKRRGLSSTLADRVHDGV